MAISVDRIHGVAGGLAIKAPVRVATTANIALSGLQTIDGVVLVDQDRVLVKNQTTGADNGIWVATTSSWSRALDFNGALDVVQGTFVRVTSGATNQRTMWELTTASPVVGTSSLTFASANDVDLVASLAGTAAGQGASMVGIQDAAGEYTATTVEAALADIALKSSIGKVVVSIAALKTLDKNKYTKALTAGYYAAGDGGGDAFYLDAADTTTADNGGTVIVATDGARWKSFTPKILNARRFGAKADGSDDATALRNCFTAWEAASGTTGVAKMVVPAGQYRIGSTIDLRTIFAAQSYAGLELDMDAGAMFHHTSALSPMIDFSTADGGGFSYCRFKFGQFGGGLVGGTGLKIRNTADSKIEIASINAFDSGAAGVGLHFLTGTLTGNYNNDIHIGAMLSNEVGMLCQDSGTPPHGFQGNRVSIGHCAFNAAGVWLQNQSTSNTFNFGSLEGNTSKGVLDQAGYNIYEVNFASGDQIELGTANGRVDITGYGFTVNNSGNSTGWVKDNSVSAAPQIPAMPASNVAYQNLFERPATVSITGGTVTSITLNGVLLTGFTSGSFRVPYGALISIIYSVAPTWVWTFE